MLGSVWALELPLSGERETERQREREREKERENINMGLGAKGLLQRKEASSRPAHTNHFLLPNKALDPGMRPYRSESSYS